MKYSVENWIFEKNPDVLFGIIVGRGLKNGETTSEDSKILMESEQFLRSYMNSDDLKTHPEYGFYRDALQAVGINPNKFSHSVEAMSKRVLKGDDLPRINALVDLCNSISLKEMISLGGHDLKVMDADLMVRRSIEGDRFLPFGSADFERVAPGEVVFVSGQTIQTRQWLWRQSELGKVVHESTDVFFQLVGFEGPKKARLMAAMDQLEVLVNERFGGQAERFIVSREQQEIQF